MLSVEGLSKTYSKVLANDNVTFSVPGGSIGVLVGPNGAGKSTTIKSIAGLLRYVGNINIGGINNRELDAKRALGYVPEAPSVYELLTVEEHLQFVGRAYRLNNWESYASELIDRLELGEHRKKIGKELSKGMQQKVSVACAFLVQPKVLLLDEPFVGLDPHAIKELKVMLAQERDKGCAVLLSTHILDSVEGLWDCAYILMKGKIVASLDRAAHESGAETLEQMFFRITEGEARP